MPLTNNHQEIDLVINSLIKAMLKASKLATSPYQGSGKDVKVSRSIIVLISKKRKLRKTFQLSRSPIHSSFLDHLSQL